jgi:hypothetical protein
VPKPEGRLRKTKSCRTPSVLKEYSSMRPGRVKVSFVDSPMGKRRWMSDVNRSLPPYHLSARTRIRFGLPASSLAVDVSHSSSRVTSPSSSCITMQFCARGDGHDRDAVTRRCIEQHYMEQDNQNVSHPGAGKERKMSPIWSPRACKSIPAWDCRHTR